jgi:hypothetical protein
MKWWLIWKMSRANRLRWVGVCKWKNGILDLATVHSNRNILRFGKRHIFIRETRNFDQD